MFSSAYNEDILFPWEALAYAGNLKFIKSIISCFSNLIVRCACGMQGGRGEEE